MKSGAITIFILLLSINCLSQTIDSFDKFKVFSTGEVNLVEGEKLIVVFNTNCDHCQETAAKLATYSNQNIPSIYALFYNEIEEVGPSEFKEKTNTDYPFIVLNDDDFWPLIKSSPPIVYHLIDGEIFQYFEGEEIAERINTFFK